MFIEVIKTIQEIEFTLIKSSLKSPKDKYQKNFINPKTNKNEIKTIK